MDGAVIDTPAGIDRFRLICLKQAISLYLKTGILATRSAKPARMRELATEYTGKAYPRSRNGLEAALADLIAKLEAGA